MFSTKSVNLQLSVSHVVSISTKPKSATVHVAATQKRHACQAKQLAFRSSVVGNSTINFRKMSSYARTNNQAREPMKIVSVFERFTERAIKAVMLAQQEAKALGKPEVGTEHLFIGLIVEENSKKGFLNTGLLAEKARTAAVERSGTVSGMSQGSASEVPFSASTKQVFQTALEESRKLGMSYLAPEHIALALIAADDGAVGDILRRIGISKDVIKREATMRLKGEQEKEQGKTVASGITRATPATGAASKPKGALQEFCVDLTARAAEGKTDPVIGRSKEVARVTQILARRQKNNPILLGEPGVGKTAIAEGLALSIVNETCPDFLKGKRVLSLDIGLVMAGAKERGELETRVTDLLSETKAANGNVILMIDEIHILVGAGSAGRGGGGLDISNLFKPALARGDLQCIGATTTDEHRKYIEKDAALERRFQPVMVDEPSEVEAFQILMGLRDKYENYHRCTISDEAVEAAVRLSARYIADRFMPDKCIDLIDEAGSRARIDAFTRRKAAIVANGGVTDDLDEAWEELRQVKEAKDVAVSEALFEEASLLRDREQELWARINGEGENKAELAGQFMGSVGVEEIQRVASMWTGIPLDQLSEGEVERLQGLESILHKRVVGQNDAVSAISRALRRARAGIQNPNRPIASMLFSGPTGVGKTELTKALAEKYFGSEESIIRLDMSEYMERHTVSKLIGSPPGYIGYGEGGKLTEAVRRKPFSIVLLDEIEKAHPDVFNVLLQIMEDGRLSDSAGKVVSFKNTLVIMTSNVGSHVISKGGSGLGFQLETNEEDGGQYSRMRDLVMEELKGFFKPELLNRLDEVVVFRQLDKQEVGEIAHMMLDETATLLGDKGVTLELTQSVVDHLLNEGYDQEYGARPMRRAIMSIVHDTLSDSLLKEDFQSGDAAILYMDQEKMTVKSAYRRNGSCNVDITKVDFSSQIAYASKASSVNFFLPAEL